MPQCYRGGAQNVASVKAPELKRATLEQAVNLFEERTLETKRKLIIREDIFLEISDERKEEEEEVS